MRRVANCGQAGMADQTPLSLTLGARGVRSFSGGDRKSVV